jgi:hypothetical protein
MGLVFGQHHRAGRQLVELLAKVGQHLLAVGVAVSDQPGSPSVGDLADPAAQGALADGRSAQPLADRPGLGVGQQPPEPVNLGETGHAGNC